MTATQMLLMGVLVLGFVGVRFAYANRLCLLAENTPRPPRRPTLALVCMTLVNGASLAGMMLLLSAEGPQPFAFSAVPPIILASYISLFFLLFHLDNKWRKSPFFFLTAMAPFFGSCLCLLVWLNHRRNTEA